MRSPGRHSHQWQVGLLLLATVLAVISNGSTRATWVAALEPPIPEDLLAARLGGTRASFAEVLGAPAAADEVNGSRFDVTGFGLVLAQFRQTANDELRPADRAILLTLRAPRPETAAATTPDPNDWTLDQVFPILDRFLPADVALDRPATPAAAGADDQGMTRTCRSAALAAAFPAEPAPGACQISFLMPTPLTVSYVTILLGAEDEGEARGDRCAGMREWGQQTGQRMQSALATLGDVAAIAEDDPTASTQLRTAATLLAELSTAQSEGPTPRAARQASEQLVAAFDGFASAIETAATGIETRDQAVLTTAVDDLDAARAHFDAANALVLSVLQRCGLSG
jgi:hypothetical protein